jgi:hypothetical protein
MYYIVSTSIIHSTSIYFTSNQGELLLLRKLVLGISTKTENILHITITIYLQDENKTKKSSYVRLW